MSGDPYGARLPLPPVVGYAGDWSLRPGDDLAFHLSAREAPCDCAASIVRLRVADTGPDGPPYLEEHVPSPLDGTHRVAVQATAAGSFLRIEPSEPLAALQAFALELFVRPGLGATGRPQLLFGSWASEAGRGLALILDEAGRPAWIAGDGKGAPRRFTLESPLRAGCWYGLRARLDRNGGAVALELLPLPDRRPDFRRPAAAEGRLDGPLPALERVTLAGTPPESGGPTAWQFQGRLEAPRLWEGAEAAVFDSQPFAAWDFAEGISGDQVPDLGPHGLHGHCVNRPKRAVRGRRWDGSEQDWRDAPAHYAAIHFHAEDIADAGWAPTLTWRLPDELRSGVYALKLEAGGTAFHAVFFVRPAAGRERRGGLAFLASTATYLAYANYRRRLLPGGAELFIGALPTVDPVDLLLPLHPEWGASTYDSHADGGGVSFSTRKRPIVNLQPTDRLWNFTLDLLILDWLEAEGLDYDIVTDEDLAREGPAAIASYRCLLTGSHPEYWSTTMLDGLESWLGEGGRLIYLGGNGFYWRVSHLDDCAAIEMRRAEDGTRAWAEEPGEYRHQSDGVLGGLLQRCGRPPNALVGIGFVAQGFDASAPYRRLPAADDPRCAFAFEGIGEAVIGDFGLAGGGAAGLELDATDPARGTPAHALVLARSEGHSNAYQVVNEETLVAAPGADGFYDARVRAELTFFEHPGGGAVFSTGSIGWAGSLWRPGVGYGNPVSRLTGNVVRRFLDPTPFPPPPEVH